MMCTVLQQDCSYTTTQYIHYWLVMFNLFHTCLFHKCRQLKTSHRRQLLAKEWSQQNCRIEQASNCQTSGQKWKLSSKTLRRWYLWKTIQNSSTFRHKTKSNQRINKQLVKLVVGFWVPCGCWGVACIRTLWPCPGEQGSHCCWGTTSPSGRLPEEKCLLGNWEQDW